MIFDTITDMVRANPMLAGALIATAGGAITMAVRRGPTLVMKALRAHMMVSIEIRDNEAFRALALWLADQQYSHHCRRLAVRLEREGAVRFSPGRGHHVFRHGRRSYWLERAREEVKGEGSGQPIEYMVLRTWGRQTDAPRELMEMAAAHAAKVAAGKPSIYLATPWATEWRRAGFIPRRSPDSIILREGVLEHLTNDMECFLGAEEEYAADGIPYQRTYMLYGPPGTGKTSVAEVLAGQFGLSLYLLNLSDPGLNDSKLLELMAGVPHHAIVLAEDIDSAFNGRETSANTAGRVTHRGLLNAIDGVMRGGGRILVFTTNHPERLDPAQMRAGRADVKQIIDNCDGDMLRRAWLRYYPSDTDGAALFAALNDGRDLPMSDVQEHFKTRRGDRSSALTRIERGMPVEADAPLSLSETT